MNRREALTATKPKAENFEDQDVYLEALDRWRSTVGRILSMTAPSPMAVGSDPDGLPKMADKTQPTDEEKAWLQRHRSMEDHLQDVTDDLLKRHLPSTKPPETTPTESQPASPGPTQGRRPTRDPLMGWMRAEGIPLTKGQYLHYGWPDGIPKEHRAEIMGSLPWELTDD